MRCLLKEHSGAGWLEGRGSAFLRVCPEGGEPGI